MSGLKSDGIPRPRRALGLVALGLAAALLASTLTTVGAPFAPAAHAATEGRVPAPDGAPWLDADGQPIAAHGGSVVQVSESEVGLDITGDGTTDQDVWLWYGEDKTNATRPVDGVRGYWSTDLTTWHDMGRVLPSHQFFTLQVSDDGSRVEVDPDQVELIKGIANKTVPDEHSTQDQIDEARTFVHPYVETWADESAGIAATYDEQALAHASYRLNGNINIMERPKMLWNEKTRKFVIIYHADGPLATSPDLIRWVEAGGNPSDRDIGSRYSLAEIGFATSDTPWGPFKLVNTTKMNYAPGVPPATREGDSRDMTVFQDAGTRTVDPDVDDAYAIYSSEMNRWMYVSRLNAEYTGPLQDGTEAVLGQDFSNRVLPDQHREASAVFKHGDWYYMITSGTDGWASTRVVSYRSQSMITDTEAVVNNHGANPANGQWERVEPGNPCIGDPNRTGIGDADPERCFDSQPTFVITLDEEAGHYIYMGDRWQVAGTGSAGSDSSYVWAPIQVDEDSGSLRIENVGEWDPTNASLFHPLPSLALTAHVNDRDDFDPVFSLQVGGEEYSGLTARWNQADLDAAFAGAGTHRIAGHIDDGPLTGRQVDATLQVDGPINICTQSVTSVSASFHQTQYQTLPPALACDGDGSTSWSTWASSGSTQNEVTFTAEFTSTWDVERVVFTNTEGNISGGSVEYRDPEDGQWHEVDGGEFGAVAINQHTQVNFDAVAATGVRLTFDTPGSFLKINEIGILGHQAPVVDPVNVCLAWDTAVLASFHQTNSATRPAALACDANPSTSWGTWAPQGTRPSSVEFTAEFGRSWHIDQFAFTNTEGGILGIDIEYRDPDSGEWQSASPASTGAVTNGSPTTIELDPVTATGVRLTFDVGSSWLQIPEIEIMGVTPVVEETPVLESIQVTQAPDRTEYEVGELIDLDGLIVTATYDDGATSTVPVAALTVTGFDSAAPGERTITVAYTDGDITQTATFTVVVLEPQVGIVELVDPATGVRVVGTEETLPGDVELVVILLESGPAYDALHTDMPDVGAVLYDITLVVDGEEVQPLGEVRVHLPVPEDADADTLVALHVDDDLIVSTVASQHVDGEVSFGTTHFSVFGLAWLLATDDGDGDGDGNSDGNGDGGSGTDGNGSTGQADGAGGDEDLAGTGPAFSWALGAIVVLVLVALGWMLVTRSRLRDTALD